MQEVYYVYKARETGEFKLVADRGRRLSDIEVDVSIAHQENMPLGSIRWHKVIVNPADAPESLDKTVKWQSMVARRSLNKYQDNDDVKQKVSRKFPVRGNATQENLDKDRQSSNIRISGAVRWESLLMPANVRA